MGIKKVKKMKSNDWNKADKNGTINIPDEYDKLFNQIGMQMQLVTISGKNKVQATADILRLAEKFFNPDVP
ncbi:MAG TPA: hypothetical protein DCS19_01380 [Flavobacterium sp.]|nr:hypothetical protein [Flavobacterium sp.]